MAEKQIEDLELDSTIAVTYVASDDTVGGSSTHNKLRNKVDPDPIKQIWVSYQSDDNIELLDVFSEDTVRDENEINQARVRQYREQLTSQFLDALQESDFEFGYDSISDIFVRQRLSENSLAIKEWLNDLFINYFDNFSVTAGILRVIAHIEYDQIMPQGPTMALAALSHESLEIKELGIRAFENWGSVEALNLLENIRLEEEWIETYLSDVICDLKDSASYELTGS